MSEPHPTPSNGLPEGSTTRRTWIGCPRASGFKISKFPQATPERVAAARKNVPEILTRTLIAAPIPGATARRARRTNSSASSSTSLIPARPVRPRSRSRDGNILGLRPAGYEEEITTRPRRQPGWGASVVKPPPGYQRRLAKIAAQEDRFRVPREMWTDRDWRVQREQEAKKRDRRAKLIASQDRPVVLPPDPHRGGLLAARPDEGS